MFEREREGGMERKRVAENKREIGREGEENIQ
jgi:hypothetical protein